MTVSRSIKCLTLTDPWATLVAVGAKRLETRSWAPRSGYRGLIGIHAGLRFPVECEELCYEEPFESTLRANGFHPQTSGRRERNAWQFPLGHIIAVAHLTNVIRVPVGGLFPDQWQPPAEPERSFGNFAPGRYVWELSSVYRLRSPIRAKGALGLWDWQMSAQLWEEIQGGRISWDSDQRASQEGKIG